MQKGAARNIEGMKKSSVGATCYCSWRPWRATLSRRGTEAQSEVWLADARDLRTQSGTEYTRSCAERDFDSVSASWRATVSRGGATPPQVN